MNVKKKLPNARRVAILGAGYMGGALTYPLSDNGLDVRLWGTWLDDDLLRGCREGRHPRLLKALPPTVGLYDSDRLAECIDGADCVILAVTSEGFPPVFDRLLPLLEDMDRGSAPVLMTVTKGFVEAGGEVSRISRWARESFSRACPHLPFQWASIGGPVKASELARGIPSATVYGASGPDPAELCRSFATGTYLVQPSFDVAGVELSSAFKNVYAMASGICDGLYGGRSGSSFDNLRALVFSAAVGEIRRIVEAAGGAGETADGLAGSGDLFVTCRSGRNRRFGELIGRGIPPGRAYADMIGEGEVAEGYRTLQLGIRYLRETGGIEAELPLLGCLEGVVLGEKEPTAELERFLRGSPSP